MGVNGIMSMKYVCNWLLPLAACDLSLFVDWRDSDIRCVLERR
jgi:hypothetical protein